MRTGFNLLRMRVSFTLRPPPDSEERTSGHQPRPPPTTPERTTMTPQVSSRERLLAELLRDLSGSNFPDLASALLPKLGCRDTTPRRRRRRPTGGRKRKHSGWLSDSGSSYSDESDSSWSRGSDDTCFSRTPDLEISPEHPDPETESYATEMRLAPLPGSRNFKGLGPRL